MKHLSLITITILGAMAMATGCGGESSEAQAQEDEDRTGSCNNIESVSTCSDYSGDAFALGESLQQSMCEAGHGTYTSGGACPAENRVGTCTISGGQVRRYYSTGTLAYTVETARNDCTQLFQGTFAE
jgi:hypothetical protein